MKHLKFLSFSIILIFGLVLVLTPLASADFIQPPIYEEQVFTIATIGPDTFQVPNDFIKQIITPDGKILYEIDSFIRETPDYAIEIDAQLMPEPFIAYGITATNLTPNPLPFNFAFSVALVPAFNPIKGTRVSSSLSYSVTDTTDNGLTVTPAGTRGFIQENDVGFPLTSIGLDDDNIGWTTPGTGTGLPRSYLGNVFNLGPQAGPMGAWTVLNVNTAFTLTGLGDIVTLNGSASINQVPEPCTIFLLCSGLLGLVGLKRRKIV